MVRLTVQAAAVRRLLLVLNTRLRVHSVHFSAKLRLPFKRDQVALCHVNNSVTLVRNLLQRYPLIAKQCSLSTSHPMRSARLISSAQIHRPMRFIAARYQTSYLPQAECAKPWEQLQLSATPRTEQHVVSRPSRESRDSRGFHVSRLRPRAMWLFLLARCDHGTRPNTRCSRKYIFVLKMPDRTPKKFLCHFECRVNSYHRGGYLHGAYVR